MAIHAALAAGPDWVARALAILSIFLTIVGFLLTWHLWRKSGPEITVVVYTATSRGTPVPAGFDDVVEVEVHNAGRLSARIREVGVWIWNEEPNQHGGERRRYLRLKSAYGSFPVEIPSNGGYISAKMPDGSGVSRGMLVQGIAKLGTETLYKSPVIRIDALSVQADSRRTNYDQVYELAFELQEEGRSLDEIRRTLMSRFGIGGGAAQAVISGLQKRLDMTGDVPDDDS